jgi:hypothetical protein
MTTFADLGIPFPLYEAPIETCFSYKREQFCCVAREKRPHCFRLSAGGYIRLTCSTCHGVLFLPPTEDRFRPKACRHCGAPAPPPVVETDTAYVSYEALRAGAAVITHDTLYGMVSWEQLETGWTHGLPGGRFENLKTRSDDEGWTEVRLPTEALSELTRTPDFVSCQGSIRLFRDTRPLIYTGEWQRQDFDAKAPAGMDPQDYFRAVVRDADQKLWEHMENVCIYVFRDPQSGDHEAYFDMD